MIGGSSKKNPGSFGRYVMAVMAKKGLRPTDIFIRSGEKIRQGRITEISYGTVPTEKEFVDLLADALKESRHTLRLLVASEKLDDLCKMWDVKKGEICNKKPGGLTQIPLFPLENLSELLSDRGIPKKTVTPQMLRKEIDNPHAFAVSISDNRLNPRLEIGDICVIAPGTRIIDDQIGILGTDNTIHLGKIKVHGNLYTVTTLFPFKSNSFPKKVVLFAYPVVDIILNTAPYLVEP